MEKDQKQKKQDQLLKELEKYVGASQQDLQHWYDDKAASYDEMNTLLDYFGPEKLMDEFHKLKLNKEANVLDLGAGTGPLGVLLLKNGYVNVDALDANAKMLEEAKRKQAYRNYYLVNFSENPTPGIEEDTYDAVLICAALGPGEIETNAFLEMIRVTKPGGFIAWTVAGNFKEKRGLWKLRSACDDQFEDAVQGLCDYGMWKKIRGPETVPNWILGEDGLLYVVQKMSSDLQISEITKNKE